MAQLAPFPPSFSGESIDISLNGPVTLSELIDEVENQSICKVESLSLNKLLVYLI